MSDETLSALIMRIGFPIRVEYGAGRWTVTALAAGNYHDSVGPGSASAPTIVLAAERLARKAEARRAETDSEMDDCDAANEREDAARGAALLASRAGR